jgi:hypothetical protein
LRHHLHSVPSAAGTSPHGLWTSLRRARSRERGFLQSVAEHYPRQFDSGSSHAFSGAPIAFWIGPQVQACGTLAGYGRFFVQRVGVVSCVQHCRWPRRLSSLRPLFTANPRSPNHLMTAGPLFRKRTQSRRPNRRTRGSARLRRSPVQFEWSRRPRRTRARKGPIRPAGLHQSASFRDELRSTPIGEARRRVADHSTDMLSRLRIEHSRSGRDFELLTRAPRRAWKWS